jgi:heme o synthase
MASRSAAALRTDVPSVGALLRALLNVFKLRIGLAIMLCALAGIAVTPGPGLGPWQVVVLALAVLLSSASAGAFNQYVERDLDARMKRTRLRPFVVGLFRPGAAWPLAIGLLLGLSVLAAGLATNWAAAAHVFLGAFVYGVVYTVWLKRRSWTNIVVGGLAGSFAVLAGAAAVDPALAAAPLILAVVLFLWTPPHFWSLATALHKDYAAAGVPMLPVVIGDGAAAWVILGHTVMLSLLALVPFWYGMGWIYLAGAAAGGAWFTWRSVELVRRPCPPVAMRNFAASLVQLTLLLAGAIADSIVLGASG